VSELPEFAARAVIGTLLRAYNRHHGTNYATSPHAVPSDPSCDYFCSDAERPNEALKIQLTCARQTVEMQDGPQPIHRWVHSAEARAHSGVGLDHDTPPITTVRALVAKSGRLGPSASDLVLVILHDFRRYHDHDLPEMRSSVSSVQAGLAVRFREVWSVWDFEDEPGEAHCLWP
jgi:hypothetical protein